MPLPYAELPEWVVARGMRIRGMWAQPGEASTGKGKWWGDVKGKHGGKGEGGYASKGSGGGGDDSGGGSNDSGDGKDSSDSGSTTTISNEHTITLLASIDFDYEKMGL